MEHAQSSPGYYAETASSAVSADDKRRLEFDAQGLALEKRWEHDLVQVAELLERRREERAVAVEARHHYTRIVLRLDREIAALDASATALDQVHNVKEAPEEDDSAGRR